MTVMLKLNSKSTIEYVKISMVGKLFASNANKMPNHCDMLRSSLKIWWCVWFQ